MRIKTNAIIFLTAAFPFLIPLVPSTDTQPTFTLFALLFAITAMLQYANRELWLRKSDFLLSAGILLGGLIWLGASLTANEFITGNVNRLVSFAMFLVAIGVGILNPNIFTASRIKYALAGYVAFTVLFFVTNGAVERMLISSRPDDALGGLLLTGRGASTLSPEPSFFAFQIFSLFLMARLLVWDELTMRGKHVVQLLTIGLLCASLAGYGMIYAALVVLLSGWRYMLGAALLGSTGLVVLTSTYDIDSLRFVQLFGSIASGLASESFELTDRSALGRLISFQGYIEAFNANAIFGDAFQHYGGGGLVSILAALGLFGIALILLIVIAVLFSRVEGRLKGAMLIWLGFQFLSGPLGLPLVGIVIGTAIRLSRLNELMLAAQALVHRQHRSAPV